MSDAGGSPPPEEKPEGENSAHINIKVKDQNENEVFFKIKKTTKLSKVFNAYCDRQSIQRNNVRFLLDGSRVQDEDTPSGLEMEDGDMLEVVLEQLGGDASPDPMSHILISIRDSNDVDVYFKMKRYRKMSKAFTKYSEFHSIPREHLCFFINGRFVREDDTPRELRLLGGDVINAIRTPISPPETVPEESSPRMIIRVEDSTGKALHFMIRDNQKLGRVMDAYNNTQPLNNTRFLFEGHRIREGDTAAILGMEDGDIIQVWTEMRGGGGTPEADEGQKVEGEVKKMLNIRVKDQDSNEVHFKIKSTTPLKKVMDAYCQRQGLNRDSLRFLFDGDRIQDNDTPVSRELVDEDCIDVFVQQLGGSTGEQDGVGTDADAHEVKPETESKTLQLKVKNSHNDEMIFRLKSTAKLGKLMKAYAVQQGRNADTLRYFLSDGKRVEANDTPELLQMEDGEVIEVHEEQQGGCLRLKMFS